VLDLSIIVVSYHSADDLPGLIESVEAAAAGATWQLTIVNNAPDEPLAPLLTLPQNAAVVESGGNLGYSGGLNVGIAHAPAARATVFLNPDLTLHADSLRRLLAVLERADAAVPTIVDAHGARQNSLRREPGLRRALGEALFGDAWAGRPSALSETVREAAAYTHEHPVDWATGAALAVRTEVLSRVGPWDERRFFMYSEETDYGRRVREGGGDILFVPDAVMEHRAGGSGSSPQLDALLEVNKLRYFRKWHGAAASGAFAVILLARNAARPHRAGARAAVRALLSRRARAALPGGPR
jgi:N-acetylglucosaminyl-diphospho-decaprenol L-rhamnosyltransferase